MAARALHWTVVASVIVIASAIGCSVLTDLDVLSNQRDTPVDAASEAGNRDSSSDTSSPIDDGGADAAGRYRDTVMADRPAAYWRLGDAPGEIHAHDEMGNYEGTFVGGVTHAAEGAILGDLDQAIQLDGTGYVNIGDKLDFAGTVPFSIEAWVATNDLEPTIASRDQWAFFFWGHGLRFDIGDPSARCPVIAFEGDGGALHDNQYHHLVATYDTVTSRLFVDGTIAKNFPCGQTLVDDSSELKLALGLVGKLDEVAIYDHELVEQAVKKHFEAHAPQ